MVDELGRMLIPEPIAATARCYESADIDVRNAFREQMRPLVATLTTERDRLREALEAQGSVIGRHGWHAILCHGYTGKDCTAECVTARRALAGTGETP